MTIIYFAIIFAIISWHVVSLIKIKLRCKKEAALLEMSKCVLDLELLKMNGEIYKGQKSHDTLCRCLTKLQFGHIIPTIDELTKQTSEAEKRFIKFFNNCIEKESEGKANKIFMRFAMAYGEYFMASSPFTACIFLAKKKQDTAVKSTAAATSSALSDLRLKHA
jgi:hypothetical protein